MSICVCVYIYMCVCMCVYVYIFLRAVYSPKNICMLIAEGGKGANMYSEYIRWQQLDYSALMTSPF